VWPTLGENLRTAAVVLVRNVGVGEDDLVGLVLGDHGLELALVDDRNPGRIELARQRRWIGASVDVRNLRGGKGDNLVVAAVAVDEVEVVEVTAGSAGDYDSSLRHA